MSSIDQQALRWVVRKADPALGEAERAAFDAWYAADIRHQGAFLRATAIDNALNQAIVQETLRPGHDHPAAGWQPPRPRLRRALLTWGALAAGVAILVGGALFPAHDDSIVLTSTHGEFRKVPLADSSVVSLNSASQVEVRLGRAARNIELTKGEAWFEVAKDASRPFVVAAADVRVRAVGTAFAVRRQDDGSDISVTEGTVEVWSEAGTAGKRVLRAGEQAFVANRASRITVGRAPLDIERKLAWRQGQLVFQNQTLGDAVADFNRYSKRRIVINDPRLKHKTLVGQYRIDAPERFARDVGSFLDVPVVVTADAILIGKAAAD
jgi:transmembrane sensor